MANGAQQLKRQLSAVLCADVVGYTSLMQVQEEATHLAYRACLDAFVAPIVGRHGGQIVKSTGDGFIARFGSVISAVSCALEIQSDLRAFQDREAIEPKLEFRLGVSSGDVIVEPDDIYGVGVNDAARLQAMAQPGAICVTAGTYEQVYNRVSAVFNDLGERQLTADGVLVRVYSCHVPKATSPSDTDRDGQSPTGSARSIFSLRLILAVIALGAFIAAAAWFVFDTRDTGQTGTLDERAVTAYRAGTNLLRKHTHADNQAAIRYLKYALRIEPSYTDALVRLSEARLAQLELFEFVKLIRDADRGPEMARVITAQSTARSTLLSQVGADLESVVSSGRATAVTYRALSRLRILQDDHDRAIDQALEARERDPGNPETLANYGLVLIWGAGESESARRRDLTKAEEMINRAVRLHPLGEVEGRYQYAGLLGMSEYLRGNYASAVEHFKQSIEKSSYHSQLYMFHLIAAFRQWAVKSNDMRAREFRNKQAKLWFEELEQRRACLSLGRVSAAWVERMLHYRTAVYKRRTLRALTEVGMRGASDGRTAEPPLACKRK